jgi:hypothetical protein
MLTEDTDKERGRSNYRRPFVPTPAGESIPKEDLHRLKKTIWKIILLDGGRLSCLIQTSLID